MDDSTGAWTTDHMTAAQNNAAMDCSEATEKNAASAAQKDITITTTIRHIYINTWALACLVGMVCIALAFVTQKIHDEARMVLSPVSTAGGIAMVRSGGTGPAAGQSSMTKETAMLLAFVYSALAWAMSNGLVLNPQVVF